jgi:pimeloyl-ACP methyl ester carboxylesterase
MGGQGRPALGRRRAVPVREPLRHHRRAHRPPRGRRIGADATAAARQPDLVDCVSRRDPGPAGRVPLRALDYPGFGPSSPRPGYRYLPEDHAQVVTAFVDVRALSGVTLVAQDWGGPIGLATSFRAKERQRWEQIFADHHTVIVEGAGHFVQSDAPREFAAAIRDWRPTLDGRRIAPARGNIWRATPSES